MLTPRPTPKLEDHPLLFSRDCLFNIFAATLHTGGRSSIRNMSTRHAVVKGTHLSWFYLPKRSEIGVFTNRAIQNLVSTSQKTQYASITNTTLLMTKKIMTVCCENIRITLRAICVQISDYVNIKKGDWNRLNLFSIFVLLVHSFLKSSARISLRYCKVSSHLLVYYFRTPKIYLSNYTSLYQQWLPYILARAGGKSFDVFGFSFSPASGIRKHNFQNFLHL